jgi:hypothetical protein
MLIPYVTISYVNEKIRKTLYLPKWIADFLDSEGQKYDGPGIVAASALLAFSKLPSKDKIGALKSFREAEIEKVYGEIEIKKPNTIREVLRRFAEKGIDNPNELITISFKPSDTVPWDELRKVVEAVRDKKNKQSKTA